MGAYYCIEADLKIREGITDPEKKAEEIRKYLGSGGYNELFAEDGRLYIEISDDGGYSFGEDLANAVSEIADGKIYVTEDEDDYMYILSNGKVDEVSGDKVIYYHGCIDDFVTELGGLLSVEEQKAVIKKLSEKLAGQ
ncbi:MAG: hypothetical protein ACI4CS_01300 [Candidatus Weimeria sp.]